MKVIATWILAALCVAGVYSLEVTDECSAVCSPDGLVVPPHANLTMAECQAYKTFFGCVKTNDACATDQTSSLMTEDQPMVHEICHVLLHPGLCEEACHTDNLATYTVGVDLSDAECVAYGEFHKCIADSHFCQEDFVMTDRKSKKGMITEHCGVRSMNITAACIEKCSIDAVVYPRLENLTEDECLAYKSFFGCVKKEEGACVADMLMTNVQPVVHEACYERLHPGLCAEECPTAGLKDYAADTKLNKDECTAYAKFHKCLADSHYCQEDFVMKGRKEKKAKITEQCESGATAPGVAMVTVLVSALVALRLVK